MNEYLTTLLGEDHRSTLLAEARADRLARQAEAEHQTWWHRVNARTSAWAEEHRRARRLHAAKPSTAH